MPVIEYPTKIAENMHMITIYVAGDDASVSQYCFENSIGAHTYEIEEQRFSNDGALTYMFYSGGKWNLEFGFKPIVTKILY